MSRVYSQKKIKYTERMIDMLQNYNTMLIVHSDNVGSHQIQQIRMAVRGRAEVLMGKNTMMRRIIRECSEADERLWNLMPFVVGNIGLVFTNDDIKSIVEVISQFKIPAAARAGVVAPGDVFVPPGPTGMDPGQTSFFQALSIPTKIVKGAVEIISEVHLIKKGDKIGNSEVALLAKLGIKPFAYGLIVKQIYNNGSTYGPEVLDITGADMLNKFFKGVGRVAALSLAIGYPTLPSIPHHLSGAFKKLLSIALSTEYEFDQAKKFKEYLANPGAFVAAAPAAASSSPAKAAAAAPAAADDESSDGNIGGGLFGGDEDEDSD